ncbi:chromatin associated protein KTI12 [Nadsonia fulvescens var. elongata DSM 6958]|uniref:Chromatin associated protein KTI12 n=1 Tax=Nadsonia fulvescens var. elongata DSM 6958 TaxID=857566 RepID=A0A1E3PG94_9ASCO|nr:chromatin associated protein KTI12 [Nadsonia fulvescens var. elongata DSM 6958]
MPLIMMSGFPSSGKTRRAEQLRDELLKKAQETGSTHITVELINDESLKIPKETYRESRTEKATRGTQMSAVKRTLSKNNIVILDNMTYIKGFRYQLFCEAKALSTNSCVIHIGTPIEKCQEWNNLRSEEDKWPQDLFDALAFRYEEPIGMNRWDSPLFTIPFMDEKVPIQDVWNTLVLKKAKPPNQATVLKPATSTNFLFELDKKTQDVTSQVLELQKINPGGEAKINGTDELIQLPYKPVTLPGLQRIRRNFISLNKMRTIDSSRIIDLFVDFLNKNINQN